MNNQNENKEITVQNMNHCGCNQTRNQQYFPPFSNYNQNHSGYTPNPRMNTKRQFEKMNTEPKDPQKLLDIIDKSSFAMDDTRLFLDTHPDCTEAKAFFKKMKKIRQEAIREYEECVGSMLAYHISEAGDGWCWNKGPLPWENQCCNGRRV